MNRGGFFPSGGGVAPIDPSIIGSIPQWIKVGNAISHTAFQTGATTNNITLFTLLAGGIIHAVKIKHSTAFAGGVISAYTLSVGIAGTLAKYATAFDVFQVVSATAYQLSNSFGGESHTATTAIKIAATSTGANLSASTAGVVDVWALLSTAT